MFYDKSLPVDAQQGLFTCVRAAIHGGQGVFAGRLLASQYVSSQKFAAHCVAADDPVALRFTLRPAAWLGSPRDLTDQAAIFSRVRCLRLLLEHGVPWNPVTMTHVAWGNRLDTLEVLLELGKARPWCPMVPTIAAKAGNVRFLMMIADAGCPLWTRADDHEQRGIPPPGTLVVPSDVESSGPVLLFVAQKGCPMTPRMKSTLREVQGRALALACCFDRAGRLGREWKAMGKVPRELVEHIATLARISIAAVDLVK
jgi:hypothetical protein